MFNKLNLEHYLFYIIRIRINKDLISNNYLEI